MGGSLYSFGAEPNDFRTWLVERHVNLGPPSPVDRCGDVAAGVVLGSKLMCGQARVLPCRGCQNHPRDRSVFDSIFSWIARGPRNLPSREDDNTFAAIAREELRQCSFGGLRGAASLEGKIPSE